ncbi:MAG: response regulator [Nitrososphaeraceae archaeon]|jgi:two-component SAPR family response regulator
MILIVDDDCEIVLIIKISLEKAGLSVSSFTDPLMALETFRQTPSDYDLVISDIRMPHLNGYDFVRQIKNIKPTVKILLMSAFEYEYSAFQKGFPSSDVKGYIEKPVSLYKLNQMVLALV